MSAPRQHVRVAAVVALAATSGCSVIVDTVYLAGDRTFDTPKVERAPTSERWEGIEYAARVAGGSRQSLVVVPAQRVPAAAHDVVS